MSSLRTAARWVIWLAVLTFLLLSTTGLMAARSAPSDQEIARAVEMNLYLDEGVAAHLIDVTCKDGIVELKGWVDSLLARHRAPRIARTTRGVRSVVNHVKVRTPHVEDDRLEQRVRDALRNDPASEHYDIEVSAQEGVVTLRGEVDSWQEKWLAEDVVRGVKGVSVLQDRLEVELVEERPDEEIREEIARRLNRDLLLQDQSVRVAVRDGRVTLKGTAGSSLLKQRAKTLAWVANVRAVDVSDLRVRSWAEVGMQRDHLHAPVPDDEVRQAILDAYRLDPRVKAFEPEVEVKEGMVTLTGTVTSLKARNAAAQTARHTYGVLDVDNRIKVRPEPDWMTSDLGERVRNALVQDPYVDRYDIRVTARNGRVYLRGEVDTLFERFHAGEVASRVKGVVEVQNRLLIEGDSLSMHPGRQGLGGDGLPGSQWRVPNDTPTDQLLQRRIQDQYFWSPYLDDDDVSVSVRNGVATLSGRLDSWLQVGVAVNQAYQAGARRVENDLELAGQVD